MALGAFITRTASMPGSSTRMPSVDEEAKSWMVPMSVVIVERSAPVWWAS